MALTRRGVLIGGLVGTGLTLGFVLRPRHYPVPLSAGANEYAFDAWLRIGTDGVVTLAMPQVEMGQGVSTLLAQVVAHELGADWRQIAIEPAPVSGAYANSVLAAKWAPLWMPLAPSPADNPDGFITRRWAQDHRFQVTADGTELAAYEMPLRLAAASARAMLVEAAAKRWNVSAEECRVADGIITHGDKRLPFGPIAQEASAFSPPVPPPLRLDPVAERPSHFAQGGKLRYPRLDLPSKVDGSWVFAGDVRLPGMVYAAIAHAPWGAGARLEDIREDAGRKVRGFLNIVRGPDGGAYGGWVAAIANNSWAAQTALKAMAPRFRVPTGVESDAIDQALDNAMHRGKPTRIHSQGDSEQLNGGLPVQHRYEVALAHHATIETAAAAARYSGGRLELWVGTQAPESVREAVVEATGIAKRKILLYPMGIGGSFDRRLESAQAIEAAWIAKEIGKPVQVLWTRAEEFRATMPRAPVVAVMGARTDAQGAISSWRARVAMPATAREFGRRLFAGAPPYEAIAKVADEADPMALEGAVPHYMIPHVAVDHIPAAIPMPTARMRGNAHGWTAFFTECFVDELAHKAGREPLSYRMAMLGKDPRLAECLQRVAALAQWDGAAKGSGQGIACHAIGDARIAVIATARRTSEGVRVERLSAVADIGRIVNYDIALQQIEGGLLFGMGLALGCSLRYEKGRPLTDRLSAMNLPKLADCPQMDVMCIDSKAEPADPSELGVAAVAPAIGNALFSATGLRLRRLPFFDEEI